MTTGLGSVPGLVELGVQRRISLTVSGTGSSGSSLSALLECDRPRRSGPLSGEVVYLAVAVIALVWK
ncbi:hypothetical protein [Actinomadura mexicana]|uniref:Uncharacterized protein n=1 Tax=Actinomadura mexicana TaxID=134959 RepID=A0A239C2T6_9ACTN|nr:hypothetical protein [Actinomadura mexicana]SNS14486.1 hypothetical protein SAMN06265355_111247 [Actinomadura mexicana]